MSPHLKLATEREALTYCHKRVAQLKQREIRLNRLRADLRYPHLELVSRLLGANLRRLTLWDAEYRRLLLICVQQPQISAAPTHEEAA